MNIKNFEVPKGWKAPPIPKNYTKVQAWRDFSYLKWMCEQDNKINNGGTSNMANEKDRDDIIGSDPDKVGTEDVIKEIGTDEFYKNVLGMTSANIKRTYDSLEDANDRRRTVLDSLTNMHIANMNAITGRIMTNAVTYDNAVHEDLATAKGKKNINLFTQKDEMAEITTRAYSGDVAGTVNVAQTAAAAIAQFLTMSGIVISQVQPKETK